MRVNLSILTLLFCSCIALGQSDPTPAPSDTVRLLNGKHFIANITSVSGTSIAYNSHLRPNGKVKIKVGEIESYRAYSVHQDGERTILYRQDSSIGNVRNAEQMNAYILGEEHALNHYNPKPLFYTGLALGLGVVMFDTYLGKNDALVLNTKAGLFRSGPGFLPFLTTFAYTVGVAIPKVSIRTSSVSDRALLLDQDFLGGFERTGRSRKVMGALKGKLLGVGVGILTYFAFQL